jgi:hypothetical protein
MIWSMRISIREWLGRAAVALGRAVAVVWSYRRSSHHVRPGRSSDDHAIRRGEARAPDRVNDDGQHARSKIIRKLGSASWRQLVINRVARVRADLNVALKGHNDGVGAEPIRRLLERAECGAWQPVSLRSWWTGSSQEMAWLSLHEAEAQLARMMTGEELVAQAIDLLAKAPAVLGASDARVKAVAPAVAKPAEVVSAVPLAPAAVAHLARAVYNASDERYAQSRGFRNRLIRLTLISLGALGFLMIGFATNAVPLPIKGIAASSRFETALLVSLFGFVGALITATPPLARAAGTWNPFSLPLYQLLLKVVLGPVFAIVGGMLLQARLIPNVQFPMPLSDLLVWALVFGGSQQAVTRIIDSRIAGLVSDEPTDAARPATGNGFATRS